MTQMKDEVFLKWANVLNTFETSWLQVRTVDGKKEEDTDSKEITYMRATNTKIYKVTADCPYCHEHLSYRVAYTEGHTSVWMGSGCYKCGKRIRIFAN